MNRSSTLILSVIFVLSSADGDADAKRKRRKDKGPAAACGLSYLPFVQGTSWTYQFAFPPDASESKGLKAKTPETFTVRVKTVEKTKEGASITLEESYREVKQESVLTCTSKGLQVPLKSFYFAGELPGALAIEVNNLDVKGDMYPGQDGLKKGESFYVDIKADLARVATGAAKPAHAAAKLELERQITVGDLEDVEVEHGIHTAQYVEVALSGRTKLATMEKKVALPGGVAKLWFSSDVGLVRAYNRLNQGWELISLTDASGANIEP